MLAFPLMLTSCEEIFGEWDRPTPANETPTTPIVRAASEATTEDIGSFIGSDGNIYAADATLPDGVTKQAVIAYVGAVPNYFDHLLAIALEDVDATSHTWADALTAAGTYAAAHPITIDGATYNTSTTGSTYYDQVASNQATTSATATAQQTGWRLPSVTDWRYIFDGIGRIKNGVTLTAKGYYSDIVYSSNATPTDPLGVLNDMCYYKDGDAPDYSTLRAKINEACGNSALQSFYWSSSEYSGDSGKAWVYGFYNGLFWGYTKTLSTSYVRAVFAY